VTYEKEVYVSADVQQFTQSRKQSSWTAAHVAKLYAGSFCLIADEQQQLERTALSGGRRVYGTVTRSSVNVKQHFICTEPQRRATHFLVAPLIQ
jgi:hypothetical protein